MSTIGVKRHTHTVTNLRMSTFGTLWLNRFITKFLVKNLWWKSKKIFARSDVLVVSWADDFSDVGADNTDINSDTSEPKCWSIYTSIFSSSDFDQTIRSSLPRTLSVYATHYRYWDCVQVRVGHLKPMPRYLSGRYRSPGSHKSTCAIVSSLFILYQNIPLKVQPLRGGFGKYRCVIQR